MGLPQPSPDDLHHREMRAFAPATEMYLDIHLVIQRGTYRALKCRHRQSFAQYLQLVTSDHQMKVLRQPYGVP